jgi:hypothetical protein
MSNDIAKAQRDLSGKSALLEKLKAIRALYITAHNETGELEPLALEFYFAIGDLLEGESPDNLKLLHIPKKDFLKELRDE